MFNSVVTLNTLASVMEANMRPQRSLPQGTLEDLGHILVLEVVRYHEFFHAALSFSFHCILRHMVCEITLASGCKKSARGMEFQ